MIKCYSDLGKHHFLNHTFLSVSMPHECHDCVTCCFSKGMGHPTSQIGKRPHADTFLKLVFGLDVKFCWSRQKLWNLCVRLPVKDIAWSPSYSSSAYFIIFLNLTVWSILESLNICPRFCR